MPIVIHGSQIIRGGFEFTFLHLQHQTVLNLLYAYSKEDLTQIGVVDGETKFKTSPDYLTTMYYDGHAGYDYPVGSVITAAAEGTLCLAKLDSSSTGSGEWRNSEKCPYGKDDINTSADSWATFHTFYIVHPNSGNLSTSWYLHASSLDQTVLASISAQGYADVSAGQVVATMGGYGYFKQGEIWGTFTL